MLAVNARPQWAQFPPSPAVVFIDGQPLSEFREALSGKSRRRALEASGSIIGDKIPNSPQKAQKLFRERELRSAASRRPQRPLIEFGVLRPCRRVFAGVDLFRPALAVVHLYLVIEELLNGVLAFGVNGDFLPVVVH